MIERNDFVRAHLVDAGDVASFDYRHEIFITQDTEGKEQPAKRKQFDVSFSS
jgi:hypothetical protein